MKAVATAVMLLGASILPIMGAAPAYAQSDDIRIDAAGATFAFPLLDLWRVKYQEVNPGIVFNYQSIGSGGGVKAHIEKTVNFGATDAPLTDAEYAAAPGTITIPVMIGAISVAFNIPQVDTLNLSAEALCGIFLGDITEWNDGRIATDNPDTDLPDSEIVTVHRADGSGTTFAFTSYLAKTCPDWDEKVGAGKSVSWPVGLGSPGNEGVAGTIRSTDNSVGYVTLAYAFQTSMDTASIENGDKTNFVAPAIASATAASGLAGFWLPDADKSWRDVDILAAPGPDSYPITSFSYIILHSDLGDIRSIDNEEHAKTVVDMIEWMITDGQQYNEQLLYVPIADAISNIGLEGLAQITYKGKHLYTGPATVWESDTDAGPIDDLVNDASAQYFGGTMDQSTFLHVMAQAAQLHKMYDDGQITDDLLAEDLESLHPHAGGPHTDTSDIASGFAAGPIDDLVNDASAQYFDGTMDQSTFLHVMAQAAQLHKMYDDGQITDDLLAEALESLHPHAGGSHTDTSDIASDPAAVGALSDGTMVYLEASEVMANEPLRITIHFDATEHANYDIRVTQGDAEVLNVMGAHEHEGTGMHETMPLPTGDPVDITVTYRGTGINEMTGPIGDQVIFAAVVPEFGTIAMIILAVSLVSMVAFSARSRISIVPRH